MRAHQKLVIDPLAYVESVGRQDKAGLIAALQEKGVGTILRVCLWRNYSGHAAAGTRLSYERNTHTA